MSEAFQEVLIVIFQSMLEAFNVPNRTRSQQHCSSVAVPSLFRLFPRKLFSYDTKMMPACLVASSLRPQGDEDKIHNTSTCRTIGCRPQSVDWLDTADRLHPHIRIQKVHWTFPTRYYAEPPPPLAFQSLS